MAADSAVAIKNQVALFHRAVIIDDFHEDIAFGAECIFQDALLNCNWNAAPKQRRFGCEFLFAHADNISGRCCCYNFRMLMERTHMTCQIWQVLPSCLVCQCQLSCAYMKKIYAQTPYTPVVPQHRSFRRFVRRLFASFLRHQGSDFQDGLREEVMRKLRHIEAMIAREMARQAKRGK